MFVALGLTSALGFLSLGTEMGLWFSNKRILQNAADAGALGGAFELSTGGRGATVVSASTVDISRNNVTAGNGTTVAINNPPVSGIYAANANAVEVIVSQKQNLLFSSLFVSAATISARSVALYSNTGTGKYCVLALDPTAADSVLVDNNAVLPNKNCGVAENSTSTKGLYLNNNAKISGPVAVKGGYGLSNNASISGAVTTGVTTADPYASVQATPSGECTCQTSSGSNNVKVNLTPGLFCNGLNFSNNATVTMAPGTYYIESKFAFQNNSVLNATGGVTIVIVGNEALNIGNNAQINITAPTSGAFAGLAIMGSRTGTSTVTQVFSNNTQLNITGAVYFPNQIVQFDNNASSNPNGCTQVIGREVVFQNNVNLSNNCAGTGVKPIGASTIGLVE